MPNSRFALHGQRPSLIHGLCAFCASNSHGLCAFFRLLLTPRDSPFTATLSVYGLHFTVYALSSALAGMKFRPISSARFLAFVTTTFGPLGLC